jgi:sensor histidine kinase YesM
MADFFRRYRIRIGLGLLSLALMGLFLSDLVEADHVYFGIYLKGAFAPLYFGVILVVLYLKEKYFMTRKYWTFFLAVALMCVATTYFMHRVEPFDESNAVFDWLVYLIGILFLISIASFLQFMRSQLRTEMNWAAFRARQNEAELKLLRQQLNPHFMFNTLNSVYAKCLEDRAEAGAMILQLSDMLRYQLEHDNADSIPIRSELEFIDNYIYFEKRRLPPTVMLNYEKSVTDSRKSIAPHLLIILVENAFKHSDKIGKDSSIDIRLVVTDQGILLSTRNTYRVVYDAGTTRIGLENMRKRLGYLYPRAHQLDIHREGGYFHTSLSIRL